MLFPISEKEENMRKNRKHVNGKQEFRNGKKGKVKKEVVSHFSTYLPMVQLKTGENSKGTKTRNFTPSQQEKHSD